MSRHLYWDDYGCTFEFSGIFKKLIADSKTFFDIGANVGYYTLLGKTINPDLQAFAFEPSKGPKHFLEENLKINRFEDVHLIGKAVGFHEGSIDFYEERNPKFPYLEYHASGIGNVSNSWTIENYAKYPVELTSIDAIATQYDVQQIDLIKMDTEGTENEVLKGGINTILRFKPIIICEVLPNKIEQEIEKIVIEQLDYLIFHFDSKTNKLQRIAKITGNDFKNDCNYFFVPREKENLISMFIGD